MPISDGYETCEKIVKLFNQKRLFSHQEMIIQIDDKSNLVDNNRMMIPNMNRGRSGSIIRKTNKIKKKLPLLVAVSSLMETPQLMEKIE